ncbi:MAG TPA: DUF932 domain-containing protein [Polyangiales bacterium]|nr:DUF932 domain-containing protein [Polyangiales bacterium]
MRIAPSVFAESAHESRSARYAHIPTVEVLRGLAAEGFRPFFAVQGKCRVEGKENFTKHMLRFRHESAIARSGADVNEVILINSHDGTSSYQMLAGCFRFVCANGLIAGSIVEDIRIKHSGRVVVEVVEGAHRILSGFAEVDASKDAFKSLQLTAGEQQAFARAALAVRYPEAQAGETPITAEQVIAPRRYEDRDGSLWATFNSAQENLTQGGLRTTDRRRRTHTRAVNGIDGNVAINRGLWVLAEEMRKLRNAA